MASHMGRQTPLIIPVPQLFLSFSVPPTLPWVYTLLAARFMPIRLLAGLLQAIGVQLHEGNQSQLHTVSIWVKCFLLLCPGS